MYILVSSMFYTKQPIIHQNQSVPFIIIKLINVHCRNNSQPRYSSLAWIALEHPIIIITAYYKEYFTMKQVQDDISFGRTISKQIFLVKDAGGAYALGQSKVAHRSLTYDAKSLHQTPPPLKTFVMNSSVFTPTTHCTLRATYYFATRLTGC